MGAVDESVRREVRLGGLYLNIMNEKHDRLFFNCRLHDGTRYAVTRRPNLAIDASPSVLGFQDASLLEAGAKNGKAELCGDVEDVFFPFLLILLITITVLSSHHLQQS